MTAAIRRGVLLAGAVSAAVAVGITFRDQSRGCGTDLRHKVVGARAMLAGLDPYAFEWRPGMPLTLLDPRRRQPGPSMATYTPPTLAFYAPLAWVPYWYQKRIWFVLEWAALAASAVMLARIVPRGRARLAFAGVVLFFFMSGRFWRLHVERGQYYVFVLLLVALAVARCLRRGDDLLSGVPIGMAAALRPTFVVLCLPLWLLGLRRTAAGTAATFAVVCAATLPLVGWEGWKGCFATARAWERLVVDPSRFDRYYGPAQEVPKNVEGVDFTQLLNNGVGNATLLGIFQKRNLESGVPVPASIPLVSRVLALAVVLGGTVVALVVRRRKPLPRRYVMAFGVLLALNLEYFLPARIAYADVLYLLPLALMMPLVVRGPSPYPAALVATGLVLGHPLHEGFEVWLIPDLIRALLVVGTLSATLAWAMLRRGPPMRRRAALPSRQEPILVVGAEEIT